MVSVCVCVCVCVWGGGWGVGAVHPCDSTKVEEFWVGGEHGHRGFFAADPITDKNASKSGNLNIILRYFKGKGRFRPETSTSRIFAGAAGVQGGGAADFVLIGCVAHGGKSSTKP